MLRIALLNVVNIDLSQNITIPKKKRKKKLKTNYSLKQQSNCDFFLTRPRKCHSLAKSCQYANAKTDDISCQTGRLTAKIFKTSNTDTWRKNIRQTSRPNSVRCEDRIPLINLVFFKYTGTRGHNYCIVFFSY